MKSAWTRIFLITAGALLLAASLSTAAPTPGAGWGQIDRDIDVGNMWDRVTNRHYGGNNWAFNWPGGWYDMGAGTPVERRTYANYKGFIIGATDVPDPQFPTVVWPFIVGQRDGRNDGELGLDILAAAPDVNTPNAGTQIIFKGRRIQRTFRQAYPVVTTDGVVETRMVHKVVTSEAPELAPFGDAPDAPYQSDLYDPTLPADLKVESYSWSRMGIATNRTVYAFVDRENDDYHFWHWRMINDGVWGRLGHDKVDCCGGTWGTVKNVMMGFMFQWDRASAGAARTGGAGDASNDSIWRYYGVDYDGARTEDMRLVYVIDGDQAESRDIVPAGTSGDDIGDPDPTTGELLSAKTGGWQILHYDVSTSDRHDDPAQPRTIGWTPYNLVFPTSIAGHEAKYNQMLLGQQNPATGYPYYPGTVQETPGRGKHPNADSDGASWIKISNDPTIIDDYWPGKVLGVDTEVNDIEQQAGFGPDDIAPGDTINGIHALAVAGLTPQYAQMVGKQWVAGTITDAQKNAIVHSTIDSLFDVMRQAKSVYESQMFGDRYASTRSELESALRAAVTAGKLTLSPPAPATFNAQVVPDGVNLSWTLNTTTGSNIAGYKVYRALANFKNDSVWTPVYNGPANVLSWKDQGGKAGFSYYYYLTSYDAAGNESTMHTRTAIAIVPTAVDGTNLPGVFDLSQNAPNPFNPSTVIRLSLAQAGPARLDIYNVNGQLVRTLVNGSLPAGTHEVAWDGTDAAGRALASGTYIYRLSAGDNIRVRRMVLAR